MSSKVPKSMLLRACLYPSPDVQGLYVAHCLELDLIGEGKTPKEAMIELIEAIELQIEACEHFGSLFAFPAPPIVWLRYKQAKNAGRAIMQRIVKQAQKEYAQKGNVVPEFDNVLATNTVPEEYCAVLAN